MVRVVCPVKITGRWALLKVAEYVWRSVRVYYSAEVTFTCKNMSCFACMMCFFYEGFFYVNIRFMNAIIIISYSWTSAKHARYLLSPLPYREINSKVGTYLPSWWVSIFIIVKREKVNIEDGMLNISCQEKLMELFTRMNQTSN